MSKWKHKLKTAEQSAVINRMAARLFAAAAAARRASVQYQLGADHSMMRLTRGQLLRLQREASIKESFSFVPAFACRMRGRVQNANHLLGRFVPRDRVIVWTSRGLTVWTPSDWLAHGVQQVMLSATDYCMQFFKTRIRLPYRRWRIRRKQWYRT